MAYASALIDGFSDFIFIVIDLADPTRPVEAGRWWIPGMNLAAGETPGWPKAPLCRFTTPSSRASGYLPAGATAA